MTAEKVSAVCDLSYDGSPQAAVASNSVVVLLLTGTSCCWFCSGAAQLCVTMLFAPSYAMLPEQDQRDGTAITPKDIVFGTQATADARVAQCRPYPQRG